MRLPTFSLLAGIGLAAAAGCHHSAPSAAPTPAHRSSAVPHPAASRAPTRANAEVFAEELISRTNGERRAAGLPPLTRSVNLMRAAEIQASQMAHANLMEHDIPGAAYPSLASRLAFVKYPIRAAGENIGEGYHTPSAAIAGWMGSPGHRANILSATYTEMGAAMAPGPDGSVFWVQVFGKPK